MAALLQQIQKSAQQKGKQNGKKNIRNTPNLNRKNNPKNIHVDLSKITVLFWKKYPIRIPIRKIGIRFVNPYRSALVAPLAILESNSHTSSIQPENIILLDALSKK